MRKIRTSRRRQATFRPIFVRIRATMSVSVFTSNCGRQTKFAARRLSWSARFRKLTKVNWQENGQPSSLALEFQKAFSSGPRFPLRYPTSRRSTDRSAMPSGILYACSTVRT